MCLLPQPRSGAWLPLSQWNRRYQMDKDVPMILELVVVVIRIILEVVR